METTGISKKHGLILLLILIIAASLRLYQLDAESLWNDELSSWKRASLDTVSETISFSTTHDIHPPGYQVVLHLWITATGDSESAMRLLSAIAGIAAVGLLFLLTRRFYSSGTALAAAWLMAINVYPLHYAREVRSYSLLLMMVILIVLAGDYFRNHPDAKKSVVLGLLLLITSYLHYFGLMFSVGYLAVMVLYHQHLKSYLLPIGILCIGYLPWTPHMVSHLGLGQVYIEMPAFVDVFRWMKMSLADSIAVFLLFMLMFLIAAAQRFKVEKSQLPLFLPALWIMLPWLIAFCISAIWIPVLTFPNMIIALPAVYILAAALPGLTGKSTAYFYMWMVLITGFSLYNLFYEKQFYQETQKQELREAVNYLHTHHQENQPVFISAWDSDYVQYYLDYHNSDISMSGRIHEITDTLLIQDQLEKQTVQEFWHITLHRFPNPALQHWLEDQYDKQQFRSFKGAEVIRYKKP